MRRFLKTVFLILIVFIGSWILFNRERIDSPTDLVTLARAEFASLKGSFQGTFLQTSTRPVRNSNPVNQESDDTIRIATFKLNGTSGAAQKPDATRLMTEVFRRYDVIAIQGINNDHVEWISDLLESLAAATSDEYQVITSEIDQGQRFATFYNARTIGLDESHSYTVNDPDQLFTHPPLVGWFRTRSVQQNKAFTFSLVNVQLDPNRTGQELQHLGNLYRAIRQDGRGEDDIIIVGDFQTRERGLDLIIGKSGLQSVVAGLPAATSTDRLRTTQFDNVVFSPIACVEFSGNAGVFDFMQHFNLFLNDTTAISQHLPVWAEFAVQEGARPGRVAKEGKILK